MKNKIRLRFAPSPTGKIHIGGVRTFLFNFLFAKHFLGKCFLRIEDTDAKRNIENFTKELEYLKKLGLNWDDYFLDGSLYYQSKNLNHYLEVANDLIIKGLAYKCFCSKETLEANKNAQILQGIKAPKYNEACRDLTIEQQNILAKTKPFTIRIKRTKNFNISFNDLNFGKITVNTNDIDDFVIIKEDGNSTYNFACVIDDFIMKISHVFRGQEHISNTPKQIIIQKYLGYPQVSYGHFSVIVDKSGKKLSKRNLKTKQFLSDYLDEGYLPAAIINFLALLGWFPGQKETEVFTIEELINAFDGKNISKNPSFFDDTKLLFFNHQHLKKLGESAYLNYLETYAKSFLEIPLEKRKKLAKHYQCELQIASELEEKLIWLKENKNFSQENHNLIAKNFHIAQIFYKYLKNNEKILYEELINFLVKEKQVPKNKNLFFVIRLLITRTIKGPELKFIFSFYKHLEIKNLVEKSFELLNLKYDH